MNYLQKILSKEKENTCNPNRESMILDYVLTMLGRGDSLDTINEVARLLRKFEVKETENLDNPITFELLKDYGFKYIGKFTKCYELEIKKEFRTFIFGICLRSEENNNSFSIQVDGNDNFCFHYGLLKTEKDLINLVNYLFQFKLTKKQ